jgi:YbbR domain-containing protein
LGVTDLLRAMFSNLPLKLTALFLALLLWAYAVLERTYDHRFTVPVLVQRGTDSTSVVTDIDAERAVVQVEAKGKDLVRLKYRQMAFRPEVPAGRSGTRQVRLSAGDLNLPPQVAVRSLKPEAVEMRLSPAAWREVEVAVPTRGRPNDVAGRSVTVLAVTARSRVRVTGPEEDLALVAAVNAETLDLGRITHAGRHRLRVLAPQGEGFRVRPESVDVDVVLEREGARILFDVPVRVATTEGVGVDVEPEVAQIAVAGPQSRIDSLRAGSVSLTIRIASPRPGSYRLAAEVSELPPGFRLVKCEPALFDVTVR